MIGVSLSGIVVNLRQLSRLVLLDWYSPDSGKVYFTVTGQTGYYAMDIDTEIITIDNAEVNGVELTVSDTVQRQSMLSTGEFKDVPRSNKLIRKLVKPNGTALQLIIAVLRHQVVGDKLTKGLRLESEEFCSLNATIKDHYLGGYLVTIVDGDYRKEYGISELINHLLSF